MSIVVAYGSVPKDGGTFTFYKNIRKIIQEYGIDLKCVTVGRQQSDLIEKSYIDEGCIAIAINTYDVKEQSYQFVKWCEQNSVNIVIGVNSEPILSSFPHLPEKIRCVSRCANAFDHGYRITMSGRERLAAIIALTPRLRDDLIEKYSANPKKIHLIPNGIDSSKYSFKRSVDVSRCNKKINLGFLGRLEDNQKGVFHLPEIVKELNRRDVDFVLRIAGKGRHRRELEKELYKVSKKDQIEFLGAIPASYVPKFLSITDVFLFTSHFEGCPNALLEAMMAGCIPVSWIINGITDFIIDDGNTGYLIKTGDYVEYVNAIAALYSNKEKMYEMSLNVVDEALKRFKNEETAFRYAEVFKKIMKEKPPKWSPVDWKYYKGDESFKHSIFEKIMPSVYGRLKKMKIK